MGHTQRDKGLKGIAPMKYTIKDARIAFDLLCNMLNKSQVTSTRDEKGYWKGIPGSWMLDNSPSYGGVTVQEIINEQGGQGSPFGYHRMKPAEFVAFVYSIRDGLLQGAFENINKEYIRTKRVII